MFDENTKLFPDYFNTSFLIIQKFVFLFSLTLFTLNLYKHSLIFFRKVGAQYKQLLHKKSHIRYKYNFL